jgi:hypothetical protein
MAENEDIESRGDLPPGKPSYPDPPDPIPSPYPPKLDVIPGKTDHPIGDNLGTTVEGMMPENPTFSQRGVTNEE